jgi:hypothetical protein
MEDGDAHEAGGIDIWMPYFGFEDHFGWLEGVVTGEGEEGLEETALVQRVLRATEG